MPDDDSNENAECEDRAGSDDAAEPSVAKLSEVWEDGEVWFENYLRDDVPWGNLHLLDPIPEEMRDLWVVKLGASALIGERRHRAGTVVPVENAPAITRLIDGGVSIAAIGVPWLDRLIPAALTAPYFKVIKRKTYLKNLLGPLLKTLLVLAATVAGVYVSAIRFPEKPELILFVIVAGIMFGLFPFLQIVGLAMVPVHRLSVEELNRNRVNYTFFFFRFRKLSYSSLKIGLAVLGLVFVAQWAASGFQSDLRQSFPSGALLKSAVLEQGEWWRLVTSGLLHGLFLHFALNALALYNLGRLICAVSNASMLAIVFAVSVVTGALASLYFGPDAFYGSVGASGGACGCLGYLLVLFYRFRGTLPGLLRHNLVQATIVMIGLGYLGRGFIDNAAHAGGLIGGALLAIVTWKRFSLGRSATAMERAGAFLSAAVLLAGVVKVSWELWTG